MMLIGVAPVKRYDELKMQMKKGEIMKKILALVALSFITAQSARAQVSALPGQAASEFAGGIQRGIYLIRPTDPFQNQQCGMLDAKFFAPVTLTEAQ